MGVEFGVYVGGEVVWEVGVEVGGYMGIEVDLTSTSTFTFTSTFPCYVTFNLEDSKDTHYAIDCVFYVLLAGRA